MLNGYRYCPALVAALRDDILDPCPACGATEKGDDPRRGVCAGLPAPPTDYGIRLILVDRDTGELV